MRFSVYSVPWTFGVVLVFIFAWPVFGLTVTSVVPADYQVASLSQQVAYYIDGPGVVTSIPPGLTGGTLIRTEAADASNPSLVVSFNIDVRCEVYVCFDSRAAVPAWLSGWVDTDMVVGVSDATVGQYDVYAKRFDAGTVQLSANQAEAMYFIVVKDSLPILPRVGWILKSYNMNYLRNFIKEAPEYNVNHIQISHGIMMFTFEVLEDPARRADINELINLAHAYGITEVTLWTHEFETHGMPAEYFAPDGRADGDDPGLWNWMQQRYIDLFSPGTGCPEADGIILTFSEVFNEGDTVYLRNEFKHDCCTPTESVAMVLNKMQEVCEAFGKRLYARTWAVGNQEKVRDAIILNGDPAIWMMSKNVGSPGQVDWNYMDSHHPMIGTLPAGYKELIEFDLSGEYLGCNNYTHVMTSYLKEHWNYARNLGVDGGAAVRTDNGGSSVYYSADRINLYALKEILANPAADPAAINLAWCQEYFPQEAAGDIADHYDDPGSSWEGDTRYMTWEAHEPGLAPVTNSQALSIGYTAIELIDRHRAQLEMQITLDTRGAKSDYETLRNGIALAILELRGTVPQVYGYSNFQPAVTSQLDPDCSIDIRLPAPGLNVSSVACEYSTDGGDNWTIWPVSCTGSNGSTTIESITADAVAFDQYSQHQNLIRFHAEDINGLLYTSGGLKVKVIDIAEPGWANFQPRYTQDLTPNCSIIVAADEGMQFDISTAKYSYSVDGGKNWVGPENDDWPNRYECNDLPENAGWTLVDGKKGYESVSNGILRINDTGTNWGDKVKYAQIWNVNPSVGATALARMRCPSGGHLYGTNLYVSDLAHSESIYLKGIGMLGLASFWKLMPVDTNQWHRYRITIQNQDFNVYLDENPEPIIRGDGSFTNKEPAKKLMIGSGASQYTQDIYYDYVYWRTDGAFPPNPWSNGQYDGNAVDGTITAIDVPFNQYSETMNRIRFSITDLQGQIYVSPIYIVKTSGNVIVLNKSIIDRSVWVGNDLSSDTFEVANGVSGMLNYEIGVDADWLSVDPNSGSSTGENDPVDVIYDVDDLSAGVYSAMITVTGNADNSPQKIVVNITIRTVAADFDGDGDVDQEDFGYLQVCRSGYGVGYQVGCEDADLDDDHDVDQADVGIFLSYMSGANVVPECPP